MLRILAVIFILGFGNSCFAGPDPEVGFDPAILQNVRYKTYRIPLTQTGVENTIDMIHDQVTEYMTEKGITSVKRLGVYVYAHGPQTFGGVSHDLISTLATRLGDPPGDYDVIRTDGDLKDIESKTKLARIKDLDNYDQIAKLSVDPEFAEIVPERTHTLVMDYAKRLMKNTRFITVMVVDLLVNAKTGVTRPLRGEFGQLKWILGGFAISALTVFSNWIVLKEHHADLIANGRFLEFSHLFYAAAVIAVSRFAFTYFNTANNRLRNYFKIHRHDLNEVRSNPWWSGTLMWTLTYATQMMAVGFEMAGNMTQEKALSIAAVCLGAVISKAPFKSYFERVRQRHGENAYFLVDGLAFTFGLQLLTFMANIGAGGWVVQFASIALAAYGFVWIAGEHLLYKHYAERGFWGAIWKTICKDWFHIKNAIKDVVRLIPQTYEFLKSGFDSDAYKDYPPPDTVIKIFVTHLPEEKPKGRCPKHVTALAAAG